jgi:hypothetical protein
VCNSLLSAICIVANCICACLAHTACSPEADIGMLQLQQPINACACFAGQSSRKPIGGFDPCFDQENAGTLCGACNVRVVVGQIMWHASITDNRFDLPG